MGEIKLVVEDSVPSPAAASDEQTQPCPSDKSSKCRCTIRYGRYGYDESEATQIVRKDPWERIMNKSGDIKQVYFDAIKNIPYPVELVDSGGYRDKILASDNAFLQKQIEDGCLFLELALSILGYPLGNGNEIHKLDGYQIEEMFCAHCNKMPPVVLNTLMDQKYFQDIVLPQGRTKTPSTFTNKALHELLVLPALKRNTSVHTPCYCTVCALFKSLRCTWVTTCFSKMCKICNTCVLKPCCCITCPLSQRCMSMTTEDGSHIGYASHILHGLQNLLIFGPEKHLACIEHEIDIHLEANTINLRKKDDQVSIIDHPSVSRLEKSGICIQKVENGGITSIDLKSGLWCAYLYLPAFELDDNTQMILQNLLIYEKRYFRYHYQREVSSYIKFMSRIVRTKKDAKWLADYNIVVGDSKLVPKLPAILRKLASSLEDDIVLTPQLQTVENLIREYRPFTAFKELFSFMILLTLIQVLFAAFTFFHLDPHIR